VNRSTFSQT